MAGKFEIYRDRAGEFRFRLKSGNGQVILASEGYRKKASAMNGIESVRKNATDASRFDTIQTRSGRTFLNLRAINGQVIGVSEVVDSSDTLQEIQREVGSAVVIDDST